jgi:membrane-bound lytic murein transglycosylase A
MRRLTPLLFLTVLLAACATLTGPPPNVVPPPACPACATCSPCASCPVCPVIEPTRPAEKPLQAADWSDLPGWRDDDPQAALATFLRSCSALGRLALWRGVCTSADELAPSATRAELRAWFEAQFQPWALVNPDGSRAGLVTGYYEPVLKGSRVRKAPYLSPLFAPPDDMVVVELADLYPELKNLRLRGRLEGRKLVPYYSRAEWAKQESLRGDSVLLWIDDPLDLFFMQVQGSGQVVLDDGARLRVSYADQNGHPYRSIGKWLIDQGELPIEQASMQGIKTWAKAHPKRMQELLNANPSLVFFREVPLEGAGPPGALGVPLTPERSIAVDPRQITLGAPVFMSTTLPNESTPLNRLMVAQDTGGAIRGVVRADFYWGSGAKAGSLAGRMRQKGTMWVLMPRAYSPN